MDLGSLGKNRSILANLAVQGERGDDLISVSECKKLLAEFELADEQILAIRNCVIGISNTIINSYVDEFI